MATRDLFRIDEDGFLYFVARQDDIFKSRGEKVVPREVEEVIHAVPGVREAAVVPSPDPLLGDAVHAHVAPLPEAEIDVAAVRRACAERLEDHMMPEEGDRPRAAAASRTAARSTSAHWLHPAIDLGSRPR